jgi:LytR cell envelope-related transcriptional attenuator
VTAALQVDRGLDVAGLQDLARRLQTFASGGVVFTTAPVLSIGSTRRTSAGLSSVVLLDPTADAALFDALAHDRDPAASRPATPARPSPVRPDRITVRVVDVSGTTGLGRTAASDLRAVGFRVPGAATTGTSGGGGNPGGGTVVRYGPSRQDSARTLLAALPGSTSSPDATLGRVLQVDVGTGYRPAVAVSVRPAASAPRPTPATSPPATLTAAQDPCAP